VTHRGPCPPRPCWDSVKQNLWRETWWKKTWSHYGPGKGRLACWAAPGLLTGADKLWAERRGYGQRTRRSARRGAWHRQARLGKPPRQTGRPGEEQAANGGSPTSRGVSSRWHFAALHARYRRSARGSSATTVPFSNPQRQKVTGRVVLRWKHVSTKPSGTLWRFTTGIFPPLQLGWITISYRVPAFA